MEYPRPKVVVSRCIEFDSVRWNGQIVRSEFVRKLIPHVDTVTVCPEVEIGLGVPRDTLRVVRVGEELQIMQPASGRDYTEEMLSFTEDFLGNLGEVDGFILKGRSPTSGLMGVKIYPAVRDAPAMGRGAGVFGGEVKRRFGHLALEEEGRLNNSRIREHFLRKLYTLARFRHVKPSDEVKDLVRFHTENKLLLKSYNQKEMRAMGRLVANQEKLHMRELVNGYEERLHRALARAPRCPSYINVLMNSMGYFSEELTGGEKAFFLDLLEKYREGRAPLIAPIDIMRSWIIRFEEDYLQRQTFFQPYPEELLDVDSIVEACGARDYWKEI